MKLDLKTVAPFALAFALGLGMFKITAPLALLNFWVFRKKCKDGFRLGFGGAALIIILGFFLFTYWFEYIPYKPSQFILEPYYFRILLVVCVCSVALPMLGKDRSAILNLVKYLCLGAFVFSAVTVIVTAILRPPPYYGQIIDLRALARGVIASGNTPGVANLLTFMPIVFFAGFLLKDNIESSLAWKLGFAGVLLSIACAVLLQQRSFFVIGLIIEPAVVGLLLLCGGRVKAGLMMLAVVLTYPALLWIDWSLGSALIYRKIDTALFADARMQTFNNWVHLLLADPLVRQSVGPAPWDHLQHFHNFFADIHRVSGLWALCAAIFLVAYIFVRLVWLTIKDTQAGLYLLAVSLPVFLIMITSVVPEGEKQPLVALLLAAGICERLLWKSS